MNETAEEKLARFQGYRDMLGSGRRNAFATIERCCDEVEGQGIHLCRMAIFDWVGPSLSATGGRPTRPPEAPPVACNGLGAVLWCSGNVDVSKPWADRAPHAWTTLCGLLHVDPFWLYRFSIGWSNWHQLIVWKVNPHKPDGDLIPHQDEVSRLARQISKERTR